MSTSSNATSSDATAMSLLAEGRITPEEAAVLLGDAPRPARAEPIAVLGTALRLPGAGSLDELWTLLSTSSTSSTSMGIFPRERFDLVVGARDEIAKEYGHLGGKLESHHLANGSWLTGIEQFDPDAFGFSDFEARFLGPAERLLLQVTDEALAQSGIRRDELRGSRTGVFGAYQPAMAFEYLRLFDDPDERAFVSNIPANVMYRLAYTFDLRGPVLNVDTTCSSSLTALHLARRALQAGECDLAIVASVSLSLFPFWGGEADHFVKSPRHRCASYDASADGVEWGEGIVAVVLKRGADARAGANPVTALLTGSAVNNDGTSNGMQAPNPDALDRVVRDALDEAGVTADHIGYLEGHGAGTSLGDVTEVDGLTRAFRRDTAAGGYCRLGSIKAVLGHLGDSAGLAGFAEALVCLRNRAFPGLAGLTEPNPAIPWDRTPFTVSAAAAEWPAPPEGRPRRAGVTSLGISGTNVHVVLEEAARPEPTPPAAPVTPVLISARTRWSLWELIRALPDALDPRDSIHDVAYTFARRDTGPARLAVCATDTADLVHKLGRLRQVREFERFPERLYDQHVLLADQAETTAETLSRLDGIDWGDVSAPDVALVSDFLRRRDLDHAGRLGGGRVLPLPVAPPTTRRVWPAEAAEAVDVSELFFGVEWTTVEPPAAGALEGLHVVFAGADDALGSELTRGLRARGAAAVLVTPGERFRAVDDESFVISIDRAEDYERLWEAIGAERMATLSGIVHAMSCVDEPDAMAGPDTVARTQEQGVLSLFHLARSLIRRGISQRILMATVTCRAEQVAGEAFTPSRVTAFGFTRVFSQEVPGVAELCVDHDLTGSPPEVAADILSEVAADARDRLPLVAYRAGRRLTKQVVRRPRGGDGAALRVRDGGTYVIVGGTGNLGTQVGRFLADHGAGTVVLLSRNGLPPGQERQAEEIRAMERAGTRVIIRRCDVTDESRMTETFAWIGRELGRVDGAFMLAKQLFHTHIEDLTFAQFKAGIDNRVRGTWLLAANLREHEPDFLVLFSSISSLTGTKGAAECAAVNQFLDAVPPLLSHGGLPTYTLNLTLILDDKSDFAARTPIPPIDFTTLRAGLERFFCDAHPVDLVARLDLAEVHYLREVLRIPFAPQIWREAAEFAARGETPATMPEGIDGDVDVARLLAKAWHATLGVDSPSDDDHFFATGGTSLSAVRLAHLITKLMPVRFDVADLYGHPTFGAQLRFCRHQVTAPAEAVTDYDDLLAEVESGRLDSEEAARRLAGLDVSSTAVRR